MQVVIRNNVDWFVWSAMIISFSIISTIIWTYIFMAPDLFMEVFWVSTSCATVISGTAAPWFVRQMMLAQRNQLELRKIIEFDPLTNVLTRSRFFSTASGYAELGGVVAMIDIDHFKQVNDKHGHTAGDEVLQFMGGMLSGSTRRTDLVGRYGGEEFVAFFPGAKTEEAFQLMERLRKRVALSAVPFDGKELRVTVSIGLAFCEEGVDPADVVQAADTALYEAKNTGRNRVVMSDAEPAPEVEQPSQVTAVHTMNSASGML